MTKFTKSGACIGGGIGLAGVIIAMIFFAPFAFGMAGNFLIGLFALVMAAIIPGGLVVLGGAAIGALIGYMIQSKRIAYGIVGIIAVVVAVVLGYMYKFEAGIFRPNDPNDCEGWRNSGVREVCFQERDEEFLKSRQCAQIRNETTRNRCFEDLALLSKSIDPCDNIIDEQAQRSCILGVHKSTGDITLCAKIKDLKIRANCEKFSQPPKTQ